MGNIHTYTGVGILTASPHIFDSELSQFFFSCTPDGVRTRVTEFIESWIRRSTNWATPSPRENLHFFVLSCSNIFQSLVCFDHTQKINQTLQRSLVCKHNPRVNLFWCLSCWLIPCEKSGHGSSEIALQLCFCVCRSFLYPTATVDTEVVTVFLPRTQQALWMVGYSLLFLCWLTECFSIVLSLYRLWEKTNMSAKTEKAASDWLSRLKSFSLNIYI